MLMEVDGVTHIFLHARWYLHYYNFQGIILIPTLFPVPQIVVGLHDETPIIVLFLSGQLSILVCECHLLLEPR